MKSVTSFAEAAERHLDDVYGYLAWFTGDRSAAEDLAGETFHSIACRRTIHQTQAHRLYEEHRATMASDESYAALNLAQAVAICLYELRRAWLRRTDSRGSAPDRAAGWRSCGA